MLIKLPCDVICMQGVCCAYPAVQGGLLSWMDISLLGVRGGG